MSVTLLDQILIGVYLIVCLCIGYIASRKESHEGFLIADRKVGALHLAASLGASIVGGGALVTLTALAYDYGIGASWMLISAAIVFFLFPWIAGKKLRSLPAMQEFHTLSDYLYHTFSKRVGLLTTVSIFITFFALLLVQFIAGGKLIAAISGLSYPLSVLVMGAVILIYLYLGGFKAVVKTDFFQLLVMLTMLVVLMFSLDVTSNIEPAQYDLLSLGIGQIIGFCVIGFFGVFVGADVWQRAIAARSEKDLKWGCILAGVIMLILGFTISIIGITAKNAYPNIMAEDALYYGFSNLLPPGIFGLGLIFVIASIMSSADTQLFITAMNLSNDFPQFMSGSKATVSHTRRAIIGLVVASILTAIFINNIIDVVFSVVSIGLAIAPALFGSLFWKLREPAVFYSILLGLLSAILLIAGGYISPETSIISLPVAFLILIAGQIFGKYCSRAA